MYSSSNTLPGDDIDLPFDLIDAIAKSLPEDSIKLSHVVKSIDWSDMDNIKVTINPDQKEYLNRQPMVDCSGDLNTGHQKSGYINRVWSKPYIKFK